MMPKTYGIPKERLLQLAAECKAEREKEKRKQRMLKDDAYFEEYFQQDKIGKHSDIVPVVRCEVYKGKPIYTFQTIHGYCLHDGRGPVIMRGSKYYMQRMYSTKSAIGLEIMERFFRRIKYSCADREKHRLMSSWVSKRLKENGWYVHHDFHTERACHRGFWLLGEWIHEYDKRYVELLKQIDERKSEKIKRELMYEEKKKLWQKKQQLREQKWQEYTKEQAEQHKLNLKAKRKKKAEQIAAYELLQEMKDEYHST